MPLTERTIESAIEGLKSAPGEFQRLVEYYAYLTYPHRFKNLVPQGRDPNDVPVKGWPDIYSDSSGGKVLDVVEATHSPAWSRHLEEDLEKAEALGKGRLSGFLFVAWANEPSPLTDHKKKNPRYEQLLRFRDRLIALGILPENINFVFKKQLVRALAQPRFAGVVTGILKLPSSNHPFKMLGEYRQLFGTAGQDHVFAPTKEEYSSHSVHRAALTDEVEKRLGGKGWAWVRGRGAAGKTVLAVHIGLGYEFRSLPAYYLDLSRTDVGVPEALDVITTHSDDGVLFIVDNVHLNQAFARDCFDHWQSASGGSHLLMIGRDTTTFDFRGTALPLDDLKIEALTLEVRQEDLEGVFLRLARRALSSYGSVPRPPQDVLERWHKLFGGDLIAFSAGVAQRLKRLAQNDWAIQAQDAAKYVQAAYLRNADEGERLNLLRLAVLAQLELDVPEEALDLAKVEPVLQSGLVHFVGRGRDNQYGYYRLVHPGLGDLLLTAAGYSDGELKQFISEQWGYVACRNLFVGMQVVGRLESSNRVQEATLILKGIAELENGLEEDLITLGLQYLRTSSERLTRLGVLTEFELDEKLAAINPNIYQTALSTQLNFFTSSLGYAEKKLPKAYASIRAALERPEGLEALRETAMRTPLDHLASFLGYAEQKLPIINKVLIDKLIDPVSINALAEVACRTPLGNLLGFLQTGTLGPAVLLAIDHDKWSKSRLESRSEHPPHFPAIVKVFQPLGRLDLAEAPAVFLIKSGEQQHWHAEGIGLYHLSYVMRLGKAAGAEAIFNFITRIATPAWLKEQYSEATSYGIASALFGLWGYHEQAVLDHFRVEALKSRVRYELNNLSRMTPENLSAALQLLGASALIGARVGKIGVTWPNVEQVNDAVRPTIPPAETTVIGYITIQVWLGLRVMAGMRPDPIYIQPELGNRVLTLWKNSAGVTDKQNALNKWMINWLERCARSGWMLIADRREV